METIQICRYSDPLPVRKIQKFGGVFDAIGRAKQRWHCTTSDRGGFGDVLCDQLRQAVFYFTQQPWASRASELRLSFVPWQPKGAKQTHKVEEAYRVLRQPTGWTLICR